MSIGVFILCVGFTAGVGAMLLLRHVRIPLTHQDRVLCTVAEWTKSLDKKVWECFDNEDKDYRHLLRNLDHYTRPAPIVNLFDERYVVITGTQAGTARLILADEWNKMQRRRMKQIKECECPDDTIQWEDLATQLTQKAPTHADFVARISRELAERGIECAGEYTVASRSTSRRRK